MFRLAGATRCPVSRSYARIASINSATPFARALGAARSGHPEAAKGEIAKLDELHGKFGRRNDNGGAIGNGASTVCGYIRGAQICRWM